MVFDPDAYLAEVGNNKGGAAVGGFDPDAYLAANKTPQKRGFAGGIADLGITALKGAIGVPEAAVGLADIPTFGYAGKSAEALGFRPKEAKAFLDEHYSPAQKAANAEVEAAQGFGGKLGAALANPSVIGNTVVESVPSMLAGGVMARGLGAISKLSPLVRGAIGEGAVSGGQAAENIRQETTDGLMTGQQVGAAVASGIGTGLIGAAGGKVAHKLGLEDVDTLLARGARSEGSGRGVIARLAGGAASEGLLEEMPQSMQEQAWQNAALDKPLMQGVPEAGAMGMLAGGVMGGIAGGATRGKSAPAAPQPDNTPQDTSQNPPVEQPPPSPPAGFTPEEVAAFQQEQLANQQRMQRDAGIREGMASVNPDTNEVLDPAAPAGNVPTGGIATDGVQSAVDPGTNAPTLPPDGRSNEIEAAKESIGATTPNAGPLVQAAGIGFETGASHPDQVLDPAGYQQKQAQQQEAQAQAEQGAIAQQAAAQQAADNDSHAALMSLANQARAAGKDAYADNLEGLSVKPVKQEVIDRHANRVMALVKRAEEERTAKSAQDQEMADQSAAFLAMAKRAADAGSTKYATTYEGMAQVKPENIENNRNALKLADKIITHLEGKFEKEQKARKDHGATGQEVTQVAQGGRGVESDLTDGRLPGVLDRPTGRGLESTAGAGTPVADNGQGESAVHAIGGNDAVAQTGSLDDIMSRIGAKEIQGTDGSGALNVAAKPLDQRLIPVSKRTKPATTREIQASQPSTTNNDVVSVKDVYGRTHRVYQNDLAGTSDRIPTVRENGNIVSGEEIPRSIIKQPRSAPQTRQIPSQAPFPADAATAGVDVPAVGKEISRYTSPKTNADGTPSPGNGMIEEFAKRLARKLDKSHPGITHTPEQRKDKYWLYDVVGREAAAQRQDTASTSTPAPITLKPGVPYPTKVAAEFVLKKGKHKSLAATHRAVQIKGGWGIQEMPGASGIDAAAHEAATSSNNSKPEPSHPQIKAGNYEKGHVHIAGLDISIENPEGSTRSGADANGKEWSIKMQHHYGYIRGTIGKDKDHIDVFVKPGTEENHSGTVFVVDQINPGNGHFDEHKVMLGFGSAEEAEAAYLANYSKGWRGLKTVSAAPLSEFKAWLKTDETSKPFSQAVADKGKFAGDGKTANTSITSASEVPANGGVVFSQEPGNQNIAPQAEGSRSTRQGDLVGELKTKETDRGTALYSQSAQPAATGLLAHEVERIIAPIIARWKHGNIKVVQSIDDLPADLRDKVYSAGAEGDMEGVYIGKDVWMVADSLRSEHRARKVLAHEAIGHMAMEEMLNAVDPKLWVKLVNQITMLEKLGNKLIVSIGKTVDERQPGLSQKNRVKEILAIMAEEDIQNDPLFIGAVRSTFQRFIDGIKAFMKLVFDVHMTDREVLDIVKMAERHLSEKAGESSVVAGMKEVLASKSPMKNISINIRRGRNALAKAVTEKTSVHRAMFRNGLGWVDFVWGSEGKLKPSGKTVGAMGISHIFEARARKDGMSEGQINRLLDDIVQTIASGEEINRTEAGNSIRVGVEQENTVVWMVKRSGSNAWVVTGYEKTRDVSAAGRATTDTTHVAASRTRDDMGAGVDSNIAEEGAEGNPDISFSRAPSSPDTWETPEPSRLDNLIYALQDKHIDLKKITEAIRATGKDVADSINTYLQEELFHGRTAKRTKDFTDTEILPLMRMMKLRGIEMADFEEYLWMRHAEERNAQIAKVNQDMPDGGSGIDTQDARDYLNALPGGKRTAYDALAAKVDAINAGTRQMLIDYGLESLDTLTAWGKTYQHYVPLMREGMEREFGNGTGQGYSVKGNASKRATGSKRAVVDILANLAMQRERTIIRGEKNRVSTALVGLASLNPSPDFWKVDEPPKIKTIVPGRVKYQVFYHGSLVEEFENLNDARRHADNLRLGGGNKDAVEVKTVRAPEQVVSVTDPAYKSRDNVVVARIPDGKGKIIERAVVFDEHVERAMRMAASLKNLDQDQIGELLGTAAGITRYFASINTQYNPIFGIINLVRDVQGAMLNLSSTPLAGKQREVLGNVPSALRGIYADIRNQRKGISSTSKWAQEWEEFQIEGGQTGFRDLFKSSQDRADALKKALDPDWWQTTRWGKVLTFNGYANAPEKMLADNAVRPLFEWLSDYNDTMENSVRLAAYKVAKESGMSKQQAASLAKNLTVNFNRKGEMGRQVGALYAFFNASVQGTARLAETLTGPAGKRIIIGGLTLGALQAFAMAMAGMGDDEPPEFVRDRSIIIPTGNGKYLTLPMPLGFNILPSFGRITTEFALSGFTKPQKRIVHLLDVIANGFNPIGNAGISMQTIAPTLLDPFAALAENKDWAGRPIARQDFSSLNPTPGHTRANNTASALSKALSEGINLITGGTDYKPGAFSPTPDQIDYLIGQVTGGVGREYMKFEQTGASLLSGEALPPHKVPLLGRFYGDTTGQSSQGSVFYANLKTIHGHESEVKGRREHHEDVAGYINENPMYRLHILAKHTENKVSELRKMKRNLIEHDAPKERIKMVETQITAQMQRLNERVAEMK